MSKNQDISLIVLSHGLWGNKNHMKYIEKQIAKQYNDSVHILNSSVNEAKYTYDGVDICGERLADDVESTIVRLGKEGKTVKKISMIGYSLGGLIVRYAIGILGQRRLFDTVEPDYFVTFATPHMGVKVPSSNAFNRAFNFISGRLVSRSGEQLQLLDTLDKERDMPTLEVMSDPEQVYFKYLSKFKTRRMYANIANDRTVPYWTAGIETLDCFYDRKGKLDIIMDDKYMSLITAFDARGPDYKKKKRKTPIKRYALQLLFFCLSPILLPIWLTIVFSVIGMQGLISRYRTSRLLKRQTKHPKPAELNRQPSIGDQYIDGGILAGALDIVNIPGESDSPLNQDDIASKTTISPFDYRIKPGKSLEKDLKPLALDETTKRIHQNLSQLEWERVWVYIRGFNAHGSIVCRQKMYVTEGGMATIQHFLDTTHLSL